MRRVVVGDDRSPGADVAWGWLTAQRWPGWTADVVTAEWPPSGAWPTDEASLAPWTPARPRVAPPASALTVRHLRAVADPRVLLLCYPDADLLVVGARGRGLLKQLHIGSTTEFLLHRPPTPLLVARQAGSVAAVLIATDGSPHARAAMATFARLPGCDRTRVRVLAVRDGRADPDAALRAAGDELAGRVEQITSQSRAGHVTAAVLDAAAEIDADLIVLGTRGLTGIRRHTLGSTAGAVVRTAPSPVLVAHAEPRSQAEAG